MSEETRHSSEAAATFPLLQRGSLTAELFFAGTLCGSQVFGAAGTPDAFYGHLHLLRRGPARLHSGNESRLIRKPSLLLFASPLTHRLDAEQSDGADLVCARLGFAGPEAGILRHGFPDCLEIALDDLPGLAPVLERLFDEAFTAAFGHLSAVNLLIELLLIMLLRHCINRRLVDRGLLAGLAHPRLARSLAAMHEAPEAALNIERLADLAGMSRSTFALQFKEVIGISPGDYLSLVRLARAKAALEAGKPLKAVAPAVGYQSATALARAFQRQFGLSPRAWLAQQKGP